MKLSRFSFQFFLGGGGVYCEVYKSYVYSLINLLQVYVHHPNQQRTFPTHQQIPVRLPSQYPPSAILSLEISFVDT